MITTCTTCGGLYEAGSEEQANEPSRPCPSCRRQEQSPSRQSDRCDKCGRVATDLFVPHEGPCHNQRLCDLCYRKHAAPCSRVTKVLGARVSGTAGKTGPDSAPSESTPRLDDAMEFHNLSLPRHAWCEHCGSSAGVYVVPFDGDLAGDMLCAGCFEKLNPNCTSVSAYLHDDASKILNRNLESAANDLLREAQLLRCLATSPRFRFMTVSQALAELAENNMGHDGGKAVEKAVSRKIVFGAKGGAK